MNREKARKAAEVMLAYADGKKIEYCNEGQKDWKTIGYPIFDWEYNDYRIKPESKYRPFKDAGECWQEMIRRQYVKYQPFGWIKHKDTQHRYHIGELDNGGLHTLCTQYTCSFEDAFKRFTFVDDTPFGIKVEE